MVRRNVIDWDDWTLTGVAWMGNTTLLHEHAPEHPDGVEVLPPHVIVPLPSFFDSVGRFGATYYGYHIPSLDALRASTSNFAVTVWAREGIWPLLLQEEVYRQLADIFELEDIDDVDGAAPTQLDRVQHSLDIFFFRYRTVLGDEAMFSLLGVAYRILPHVDAREVLRPESCASSIAVAVLKYAFLHEARASGSAMSPQQIASAIGCDSPRIVDEAKRIVCALLTVQDRTDD